MRLGERVKLIDRDNKTIFTETGDKISFSKLVLTTGARIRRLPVDGQDLENVFYLRNTSDASAKKTKRKLRKLRKLLSLLAGDILAWKRPRP